MRGKSCPNESGQSGTASPEPVLVTSPPTKIRTSVAPAIAVAKRCNQAGARAATSTTRRTSVRVRRASGEEAVLRQIVLFDLRRAVLVRPAIDGRQRRSEIAVRRRRRRYPL